MIYRVLMLVASLIMPSLVQAAPYVEGQHYIRLPQAVRTADPGRIEVAEVFWYGCPHCMHLEPLVNDWKKTLSKDVDFHGSPAMWNPLMAVHAQAYYAAEALGVLDQMHDPLFTAIAQDRKVIPTQEELQGMSSDDIRTWGGEKLADLFAEHGVAKDDFLKAFNSFGVQSSVKQADARQRGYRIDGTPCFVVDGKFLVTTKTANVGLEPAQVTQANMLKVVDFLVTQERAQRTGAAGG